METISPTERQTFDALLELLAEGFAAEGRPGGEAAAAALRRQRGQPVAPGQRKAAPHPELIALLAQPGAAPAVALIAELAHLLPWQRSGYEDGRIDPAMSVAMQTAFLLGPGAPLACEDLRVGLFFQGRGIAYTTRHHAAEETFLFLAGEANWEVAGSGPVRRGPGDISHHPSNAPHASVTRESPVLTAWRWTGEIGFTSYRLKGWADA